MLLMESRSEDCFNWILIFLLEIYLILFICQNVVDVTHSSIDRSSDKLSL